MIELGWRPQRMGVKERVTNLKIVGTTSRV